jgi:hypothetical protein
LKGKTIKHLILTPHQAEKIYGDKNKTDFITHVWAKVGDSIVFDVSTSPYLSKNPLLKFKYNYEGGDTLELVTKDNNGREVKTVKKIKSSSKKNSSELRTETIDNNNRLTTKYYSIKIKNHPFKPIQQSAYNIAQQAIVKDNSNSIKKLSSSIETLFGKIDIIKSEKVKIIAGTAITGNRPLTVRVQSNIKAKSIAIFATESDRVTTYTEIIDNSRHFSDDELKFVFQYFVQEKSIIDFSVRLKVAYGPQSRDVILRLALHDKVFKVKQEAYKASKILGIQKNGKAITLGKKWMF